MTGQSHAPETVQPHAVYPGCYVFDEGYYDTLSANMSGVSDVRTNDGRRFAVVKRTLDQARKLAALGYDAPSPIMEEYDWPGRFTPFEHQFVTSSFLTLHHRAFVFNGLGTGKTASALWAWDYLRRKGLAGRLLILCPLSCVNPVWGKECFSILPQTQVGFMVGTPKKRKAAYDSDADILVMNHDGIKVMLDTLRKDTSITHVICDEATHYKNYRSESTKALRAFLDDRSIWMMTGTPIAQSPEDAWSLGRIVCPHLMPPSLDLFRQRVCTPSQLRLGARTVTKWEPRKDVNDYVFSLLRPAVRFAKEDCIDLPPVQYLDYEAPLSAEQQKAVDAISKQWLFEDQQTGAVIAAETAAARVGKLNQIYQGCAIGDTGVHEFDWTPRFDLLCDLIDQSVGKVIVFATFTAAIDRLVVELSKKYTVEKIDGTTTAARRGDIVRAFQDPNGPRVLVAHPKTASHGLTLTAASTTVWWGVYFSAEGYEQANNRMDRPGQVNHMLIAHIYSTPSELKAYHGVHAKQRLQGLLLDMYRSETARVASIKTRRKAA